MGEKRRQRSGGTEKRRKATATGQDPRSFH